MGILKTKSKVFRAICCLLVFLLVQTSLEQVQAQPTPFLAPQNYFADLSVPSSLPVLRGMRVFPSEPFKFDFVIDSQGRHILDRQQSALLIKYFLTCLTIPQEDLWVNLSPYEKDHIIPNELAVTNAGNMLLEQDKFLKQLASSLTYPESKLGKKFWDEVYKKAYERYGTTKLPVSTYNKVWIIPDKAVVYDMGYSALIGEAHLKVMLEEDYLALKKHERKTDSASQRISAEITREIILPELEKEVNEGKNFAPVRQIFHSMILAAWFKRALKRNVLASVYVDKKKISGVDGIDKNAKEEIYKQYLRIYKVGAYNYIREDVDPISRQVVPRKYFSGGLSFGNMDAAMKTLRVTGGIDALAPYLNAVERAHTADYAVAEVKLTPIGGKKALSQLIKMLTPKLSVPSWRRLTATIALTVAVSAMGTGLAEAYTTSQNSDGSTHVALEKGDMLGVIGHHLGGLSYKNHYYEPNGPLAQWAAQNIINANPSITDLDKIWAKGSFDIRAPQAAAKEPAPPAAGLVMPPAPETAAAGAGAPPPPEVGATPMAPAVGQAAAGVHIDIPVAAPAGKVLTKEKSRDFVAPTGTEDLHKAVKTISIKPGKSEIEQLNVIRKLKGLPLLPIPGQEAAPGGAPAGAAPPPGPNPDQFKSPVLRGASAGAGLPMGARIPGVPAASPLGTQIVTLAGGSRAIPERVGGVVPADIKKFYQVSVDTMMIPVEGNILAGHSGIVTGLDPNRREYEEGDVMLILKDLSLEQRIQTLTAELEIAQEDLKKLNALIKTQATTEQELNQAQQKAEDLGQKLAAADNERVTGVVKAPHKLRITDIKLANGMAVSQGIPLLNYVDLERGRVAFDVPNWVNYFNNISLSLGTKPVKSVFADQWEPTPNINQKHLDLLIIPSSPLAPNDKVHVTAQFTYADKGPDLLQKMANAGPPRFTVVGPVEEYPVSTLAAGLVDFLVAEGDNVRAGQVLVKIDKTAYQSQYDQITRQIQNIEEQLKQSAPSEKGTQYVTVPQRDALEAQKSSLMAQLTVLQQQLEGAEIKAPTDGVIVWSAGHGSKVFAANDVVFRVSTGNIFLGDLNDNAEYPLLFPKNSPVKEGDMVLIETPEGSLAQTRIVGTVVGVNPTPHNSSITLGDVQSVKVKGFDPEHILRPNMSVKVALLNKQEREAVLQSGLPLEASLPPSELPSLPLPSVGHPVSPMVIADYNPPKLYYRTPKGQASLDTEQVAVGVLSNELVAGGTRTAMLKSHNDEGIPGSIEISLTGGVWDNNGRLSLAGGVQASAGGVAASVISGNALRSVVGQLAGNIIDVLAGRVAKERGIQRTNTKVEYYKLLAEKYESVNEAQKLLIQIGADQQKIAQLSDLARDLQRAQAALTARETAGFTTSSDKDALSQKIADTNLQMSNLQNEMKGWMVELNNLTGRQVEQFDQMIFAKLPWQESFPAVSAVTQEKIRERVTDIHSRSAQMQESIAALDEKLRQARLAGLSYLPQLNATMVGSSKNPGASIVDITPGSIEHTNQLQKGFNGIINGTIPIYSGKLGIERSDIRLDIKNAQDDITRTQRELAQELANIYFNIGNLSHQIRVAEGAYQIASNDWESKVQRPALFSPDQLVDARLEMSKRFSDIIDLKARYMALTADLWKIGQESPGFDAKAIKALTADKAQLSLLKNLTLASSLALMPLSASAQQHINPALEWSLSGNPAEQSANSLVTIEQILIEDANILNRRDAWNYMLQQYQNYNGFISSVEKIVLDSPFNDVRQQLCKYMASRKDLRFFVQIIITAHQNKDAVLAAIAQQSLEDTLTDNPDVLKDLSDADFTATGEAAYKDVSPQTAQKVMLAWLIDASTHSVAAARLWQSHYFSSVDLVGIYKELTSGKPVQDGRYRYLTGLIYDLILRNEALANISAVFSPSSFVGLPSWDPSTGDFVTSIRYKELPEENRRFLNSSEWRRMKDFINPTLYSRAVQAANALIYPEIAPLIPKVPLQPPQVQEVDFLDYFNSLAPEGQAQYIASQNISELARIIKSPTSLREEALNRLMNTVDGRTQVLKVYLESKDTDILSKIESLSWTSFIKADAQSLHDPASDLIFRQSMEKLGAKTSWALDARLQAFSALDLYLAQDPRGRVAVDAQIKLTATRWASEVIEAEYASDIIPWAGYATRTPEVTSLLGSVNKEIEKDIDPQDFNRRVEGIVNNQDLHTGRRLLSIRDKIFAQIKTNDQDLPQFTNLSLGFVGLFAFGVVIWVAAQFRQWRQKRTNNIPALLNILRSEMDRNKNEKGLITISKDMYEPASAPLQAWQKRVANWSNEEPTVENVLNDLNAILNHAAEVFRVMPFTPDLIWSNSRPLNNEFVKGYNSYYDLSAQTLDLLSKRLLKLKVENSIQRLQIVSDIDNLIENMRYVSRYSRILQYRGNINTAMRYKFGVHHSWHFWEKIKLYQSIRKAFLYERLANKSEKNLNIELPILLEEGNALLPHLYPNPANLLSQTRIRLEEVTGPEAKRFSDKESPGGNKQEIRSFVSRGLLYFGLGVLVISAAAATLGLSWSFIGISSLTLVGVFNFWITNLSTLYMTWNRTMESIIDTLTAAFRDFSAPVEQNRHVPLDRKIMAFAIGRGLEAVKTELVGDAEYRPRVNAIVIISEDAHEREALETHRNKMRGEMIRNDIPVVVVTPTNIGSGNAYFEALSLIKRKFESRDFQPDELRSKYFDKYFDQVGPWEDARVLFVFHGEEAAQNHVLIDWGIVNGYRAAQSMAAHQTSKAGGNIIVFSRDIYFGPIRWNHHSDITALTSRVDRDNLKTLSWVDTTFPKDGNSEARQVFEKLDIEPRLNRRSEIKYDLQSRQHDLTNVALKQFSAFNGIMMMGPEAVAMNVRIADELNTEANRELRKLPIHLTSDWFVVLRKILQAGIFDDLTLDIRHYVDTRATWYDIQKAPDIQKRRAQLKAFYRIILSHIKRDLGIHAFVPHPRAEVYWPNMAKSEQTDDQTKILSMFFRKASGDRAMTSKSAHASRGGIDLNFQPQFVSSASSSVSGPVFRDADAAMLGELRGFDFSIVRFTPQLTANGAFILMFNSN
jgi:outer membrane protein TolC